MITRLVRVLLYTALSFYIIGLLIPYNIVDPELNKYDLIFNEYLNKYCPSKKYLHPIQKGIYFGELRPGAMAVCQTNGFSKMTIIYDIDVWNSIQESERFSTAMHESVHCYFTMGHSDDPAHFMYPTENYLSKEVIEEQLIALIKERCK